jgi:N-acetylglutamate synthase-like GNAT family acetyltransferase/DNA-binding MarR family transcriptional regulator
MAFTHITVKNIIKELHQHSLVNIDPNPTDKRSKWISLSKKGQDFQAELEPTWLRFSEVLEEVFRQGHPDILNILDRIDRAIFKLPIHERARSTEKPALRIVDYKPSLKEAFYDLAAPWLLSVLGGELEEEDKYTLKNPDKAYIAQGGFLFYALYEDTVVGVVALKRLDEHSFEFAKLFINPNYRNLGIATRLIERCISRCMENEAKELWLQTTMSMPQAHKLYYKLGFNDRPAPSQMDVLARTEKVMVKELR